MATTSPNRTLFCQRCGECQQVSSVQGVRPCRVCDGLTFHSEHPKYRVKGWHPWARWSMADRQFLRQLNISPV